MEPKREEAGAVGVKEEGGGEEEVEEPAAAAAACLHRSAFSKSSKASTSEAEAEAEADTEAGEEEEEEGGGTACCVRCLMMHSSGNSACPLDCGPPPCSACSERRTAMAALVSTAFWRRIAWEAMVDEGLHVRIIKGCY